MNRNWLSIVALSFAAVVLINLSSCARSQQLIGIAVTPQGTTVTLTGVGQQLGTQFTALGTYIHPPETRDLTKTAVWSTDSPTIIALDPNTPGLVNTTGFGCGTNLGITATVHTDSNPNGNVVIGSATMSVSFNGTTCP